jgi:hypothetical protein
MKMTLSIYRIGGMPTLEIRINTRRSSLPRLLVPFPIMWLIHFTEWQDRLD